MQVPLWSGRDRCRERPPRSGRDDLFQTFWQKARLYFSGENLLTLDRLDTDYIDPEAAAAGTNWKTGKTNALSYPFSKTYSFGIDITF